MGGTDTEVPDGGENEMTNYAPEIDDEERRRFLRVLGVTSAAAVGSDLTLDGLRGMLHGDSAEELSSMGHAIRGDVTGELDADLLAGGLSGLATRMGRIEDVRAAGIPDRDERLYRELAAPAWTINDHLVDIGFYESVESHLPAFTENHIENVAHELIRAELLTNTLSDLGFSEREKTALVMNVANNTGRLALWMPTKNIPEGVEFDVEHVAPLHHRAAEGSLLWVDDMDTHLWQNEVLLTDDILDAAMWDIKAMLGGFHLLGTAARGVTDGSLTDSQLTAALTAGTAAMIVGQEDLTNDAFRITDEMRAPHSWEVEG